MGQVPGDVNGDEQFDGSDVLAIQSHVLGRATLPASVLDLADFNSDGRIDVADLVGFSTLVLPPGAPQITGALPESTADTTIALTGQTAPDQFVEIVGGAEIVATASGADGSFSATVPLRLNRENRLFVTVVGDSGIRSAPTPVTVIQDETKPSLFIDFPPDGAELTNDTIQVAGRVGDMLSGFMGLDVTVNAQPAEVIVGVGTNGTFERTGVPLALGENVLIATATDAVGNSVTRSITVTRVEPTGARMTVASGNDQTAPVKSTLLQPLTVRVTNEDGTPFAGKVVTFDVTRSDGRLAETASASPAGSMMLQVRTDANGEASAFWTLGTDAGCGNNRIAVTSRDISGTTFFCASADPGPASQINIGSGNTQRAETGSLAPEPLRVWVNDSGNGVPGVPVTFKVTQGNGLVSGQSSVTVTTGQTGHAAVDYQVGRTSGTQLIEATFDGNPGLPATFVVSGIERDDFTPTTVQGTVLSNANQPIEGAEVVLTVNGDLLPAIATDANGFFSFVDIPSGPAQLRIDGLVATAVNGDPIAPGSFPTLDFELVVVPNAVNTLPRPALLPPLDPANAVVFDGTEDVTLTVGGIEGLEMRVKAGSMTRADGTKPSPADPAILSLNQVHADDIPMPMPDGAAPPFAWTLQPAGATFDPPIEVQYPNMSGLPPGSVTYFLTFNHDTNAFEIFASGSVSDDGSVAVTDAGSGLTLAGWGGNCPPYPVTGDVENCNPQPNGCGAQGARIRPPQRIIYPSGTAVSFVSACNSHDISYGTAGTSKGVADAVFLADLIAACEAADMSEFEKSLCASDAWVYFKAVDLFGDEPFEKAQQEAKRCESSSTNRGLRETLTWPRGVVTGAPFEDVDKDALPDDWERANNLNVGLQDTLGDEDDDGLVNAEEFLLRTDPNDPDSNDDGTGDLQTFESQNPPAMVLDNTFTISINGQTVTPGPLGTFIIPNVSVPDSFGPDGPGSSPDGVSDDAFVVNGASRFGGVSRFARAECIRLTQGALITLSNFEVSATPFPEIESIALTLVSPTLGLSQDPSQVAVFAGLSDGTEQDVTGSPCTTYRTSNPDILLVDSTGLVSPTGVGTAIITATRLGAVSAIRVTVTESDARTTVEGFVRRADGTSVANAEVSLAGVAGTAMTDAQGQFAIANVAADTRRLLAIAEKTEDGTTLLGLTEGLAPVSGGVTDAGVIVLSSVCDAIGGTCQDTDGDCIPDNLEAAFGFSATNPDSNANGIPDGQEDPDADTLGICAELFLGTEPLSMDTDGDGLDDAQELALGLNPNDGDEDGDGIPDGQNDADGDGFANAIELNLGSNPLDPRSIPATFNTSQQVTYRFYRPSTEHDTQTLGVNPPLTYRFYQPSVAHDTQALGLTQELSYNRQ